MLEEDSPILGQCDSFNSDPITNASSYMPFKRCDVQVDCQNELKESDKILKADMCKELTLHNENSVNRNKFVNRLT